MPSKADGDDAPLVLSLVVPVRDEADNVDTLLDEIEAALTPLGSFEVLLVDDGSTDDGWRRMDAWKRAHGARWLRILRLDRPLGQSGALAAGLDRARAPLIATMDGDLQNDPKDLVTLLEPLRDPSVAGATGVRTQRRDSWVRRWSSRVGNAVRDAITGYRVADAACGIKVFRRESWQAVPRFDGMHRFVPTLVRQMGGRVVELSVRHRPRRAGRSKYGIRNRAWRGLVDCFAMRWYGARRLPDRVPEER